MRIHVIVEDRMLLVRFLENETKRKAVYSGAPLFQYQVGNFVILRDGETETDEISVRLRRKLESACLIEASPDASRDAIVIPVKYPSGTGYANIIRTIHSRGSLMNQAVGTARSFHVTQAAIRAIRDYKPESFEEFREALAHAGGYRAVKGVACFRNEIVFTGFPDMADPERKNAFRILAERIVENSFTKQWTTPFSRSESRKVRFKIWLQTLGLNGNDFAKVRQSLLQGFDLIDTLS